MNIIHIGLQDFLNAFIKKAPSYIDLNIASYNGLGFSFSRIIKDIEYDYR